MAKLQKKIDKIRNNPRNVSREKLISVLYSLGYIDEGGKGGHTCFRHPLLPGQKLTIPGFVLEYVVKQVLNSIDELLEHPDYEK